MLKSNIPVFILCLCGAQLLAQNHLRDDIPRDFSSLKQQAEQELRNFNNPHRKRVYKQYKRWELQQEPHRNGKRAFNYIAHNLAEYQQLKKREQTRLSSADRATHGAWTPLTPTQFSVSHPNNGRVNVIAVHPTNDNIVYVGTAMGGLWKTTNAGNSWTNLTDGLPVIAVSGIAIHPTQPSTLYILTGDGDGRSIPTVGILKSTDSGVTWEWTPFQVDRTELNYGYKLLMHPTQPNTMYCATRNGLYRTTNGWNTWSEEISASMRDIEFKPGSPDTVYASTWRYVYRSTNNGLTWDNLSNNGTGLPFTSNMTRVQLAVTPANPDWVYALFAQNVDGNGFEGLFISSDFGDNWSMMSDTPNIVGTMAGYNQVGYDLELVVDPDDPSRVIAGGISIYESTGFGATGTWNSFVGAGTVHADVHNITFTPNYIYIGTDGGMSRSDDDGNTWVDISNGLNITQFYDIDIKNNLSIMGGTQDNGTSLWDIGDLVAEREMGSDGFECYFDLTDTNVMYGSTQESRHRTTNGGASWPDITPPGDSSIWTSPWLWHPTRPDTSYSSWMTIWRSYDQGSSWVDTGPGFSNGRSVGAMAQSASNPNRLYASDRLSIRRTSSLHAASVNWVSLIAPVALHVDSLLLGAIEVSDTDDDHVFITMLNYVDGQKVFQSFNGGMTWSNITYDLPTVPVHCAEYDPGTGGLYVGTDLGVFYRGSTATSWTYFSNNLPVTQVRDLHHKGTYLYAGTYGRGVWRTTPFSTCPISLALNAGSQPDTDGNTGTLEYSASSTITSTWSLGSSESAHIVFRAGSFVRLDPGFEIGSGTVLEAKPDGCPQ